MTPINVENGKNSFIVFSHVTFPVIITLCEKLMTHSNDYRKLRLIGVILTLV